MSGVVVFANTKKIAENMVEFSPPDDNHKKMSLGNGATSWLNRNN